MCAKALCTEPAGSKNGPAVYFGVLSDVGYLMGRSMMLNETCPLAPVSTGVDEWYSMISGCIAWQASISGGYALA